MESDNDQTQCYEGDRIMSNMGRSHESPEGSQVLGFSQEEPVPGFSQEEPFHGYS